MNYLDILTSIILIIAVYLCGHKNTRKSGWLLYSIGSVFYIALMLKAKLFGMFIMGSILLILGIRNFIGAYREEE